jgi:cytoskeletal protein RodZ
VYICTWAIAVVLPFPRRAYTEATLGGRACFDHNRLIKIGERLREARGRRELEIADAAAQLNLHPKYLRALEWERFDLLPSPQEAGEYLRSYAELLGLDGELDLDHVDPRAPDEQAPVPTRRGRRRAVLMSLLAGCALAVAGVIAGQQLSQDESQEARSPAPASVIPEDGAPVAAEPTAPMPAPSPEPPAPNRKQAPAPTRLVVAAARGDSWVEARSGSADGPLLYRGNLEHGRLIRVTARRVWLRLGAATNLDLTLNGRKTGTSLFGTVDVTFGPRSP